MPSIVSPPPVTTPTHTPLAPCPAVSAHAEALRRVAVLFGTPDNEVCDAPDPRAPRTSKAFCRSRATNSSTVLKAHKIAVRDRHTQYVHIRAQLFAQPPSQDHERARSLAAEGITASQASSDDAANTVASANHITADGDFDFIRFDNIAAGKGTNIITSALDNSRYRELLAGESMKSEAQCLAELVRDLCGLGLSVRKEDEGEAIRCEPFQSTAASRLAAELEEEETAFRESSHAAMLIETAAPEIALPAESTAGTTFGQASQPSGLKRTHARATGPKEASLAMLDRMQERKAAKEHMEREEAALDRELWEALEEDGIPSNCIGNEFGFMT